MALVGTAYPAVLEASAPGRGAFAWRAEPWDERARGLSSSGPGDCTGTFREHDECGVRFAEPRARPVYDVATAKLVSEGWKSMESEQYVSPLLAAASIAVVFAALFVMMLVELPFAEKLRVLIDQHTQKLMLAVALGATASSLYYSEYVGFIPCEFCWFQRIAMYPIALLLLVAVVSRSRIDSRYIVALAAVGLPLSIYHFQLQLFPEQNTVCSGVISCTDRNVEQFGFVSIPFMAGAGFLAILLLQVAEWRVDHLYKRWYGGDAGDGGASVAS